jgi:hypothetical protein
VTSYKQEHEIELLVTRHSSLATCSLRLAPDSQARLEQFFRFHLRDETLRLPAVRFYAGSFARHLTTAFEIQAITFSRTIFIAPRLLRRDVSGSLSAPARLVVHELAHTLQYRRAGRLPFLFRYLTEYARGLMGAGSLCAKARAAAYRAISFEARAREAEDAYAVWCAVKREDTFP